MEPFEVLVQMLGNGDFTTRTTAGTGLIGGAPQLTKVYRYGSALPFAVEWEGCLHLHGRRLLAYEKTLNPILDVASSAVRYPMDSIVN